MKKQNFKIEEGGLLTELFSILQARREEEEAEKEHDHAFEMVEEATEMLCEQVEETLHSLEETFNKALNYILHTLKEPTPVPAYAHAPRFCP